MLVYSYIPFLILGVASSSLAFPYSPEKRDDLSSVNYSLSHFPVFPTDDIGNGVHVPGGRPVNPYEPLQLHYSFAGHGSVTVTWGTFAKLSNPTVHYGFSPLNLNETASSNTSTIYPSSRTYNNHVTISNLIPGTKYYYRVSYTNCAYCAYRPTSQFYVAPAAGDPTPLKIAVIGDMGLMGPDGLSTIDAPRDHKYTELQHNEKNTIQALMEVKDEYDFLMHLGDVGYADYFIKESWQGAFGEKNTIPENRIVLEEAYESMLEQFFDQVSSITSEKAWMVLPGNHEANCVDGAASDSVHDIDYTVGKNCTIGQTNFTFYNEKFRMPSETSQGKLNMWYSYDVGLLHVTVVNSETDLGDGLEGGSEWDGNPNGPFGAPNEQIHWLKQDLENVNRTKTPWVVAQVHRPWYTSLSTPDVWPAWQEAFEKVFYDNNVDVIMTGHIHVYERFHPLFNGTIDPNGLNNPRAPLFITSGAAGHYDGLDQLLPEGKRPNISAAAVDDAYGWGLLTVHNATHMTHDYYISRNGTLADTATLYKEH